MTFGLTHHALQADATSEVPVEIAFLLAVVELDVMQPAGDTIGDLGVGLQLVGQLLLPVRRGLSISVSTMDGSGWVVAALHPELRRP